jgi:hypothetical protein
MVVEGLGARPYRTLPALMIETIHRKVDVLVTYGTPAGLAAKKLRAQSRSLRQY